MKKFISLLCLAILATSYSCSKREPITDTAESEKKDDGGTNNNNGTKTAYYSKGVFVSGAHKTSGVAYVNKQKDELQFENFKTSQGPKVVVYLSTKVGSSDYVSLGAIKGVNGNYTYSIPNKTNLDKYKVVDIWCVDASVSFGHAVLKKM